MVDEIGGEFGVDEPVGIKVELIWVDEEDAQLVLEFIEKKGFLDRTEYENPKETGEPYRAVQYWGFNGGAEAELFFLDKKCRKLADIRMSIPVDESERRKSLEELGINEVNGIDSLFLIMDYQKVLLRKYIGAN